MHSPVGDSQYRHAVLEARLIVVVFVAVTAYIYLVATRTGYLPGVWAKGKGTVVVQGDRVGVNVGDDAETLYAVEPGWTLRVKAGDTVKHGQLLAGPVVDPKTVPVTLGFPTWIFWGVMLPWAFCGALTLWFCFVFIKDHKLTDDTGGSEPKEKSHA